MSKYHCKQLKARGRVVFQNNGEAIWGCADRTVNSNTRDVIYSACLSGRSYLSPNEGAFTMAGFMSRSVARKRYILSRYIQLRKGTLVRLFFFFFSSSENSLNRKFDC